MSEPRQFVHAGAAQRPLFVGVDLGGTNIKVGVVDAGGGVLSWLSLASHVGEGPAAGSRRIADAAREAISRAGLFVQDIEGIGLGSPGGIDPMAGAVLFPVNLPGWSGFRLRDAVA